MYLSAKSESERKDWMEAFRIGLIRSVVPYSYIVKFTTKF